MSRGTGQERPAPAAVPVQKVRTLHRADATIVAVGDGQYAGHVQQMVRTRNDADDSRVRYWFLDDSSLTSSAATGTTRPATTDSSPTGSPSSPVCRQAGDGTDRIASSQLVDSVSCLLRWGSLSGWCRTSCGSSSSGWLRRHPPGDELSSRGELGWSRCAIDSVNMRALRRGI